MAFLRSPAWAEGFLPGDSSKGKAAASEQQQASSSTNSSSSLSASSSSLVAELVQSLVLQRQRREVALRLREALRDVRAEFSFARVKGLRRLLAFLTSAVASERGVELFRESQRFQELQVVPALFKQTLAPQRSPSVSQFSCSLTSSPEGSIPVVTPPTPAEIVLALRVLEGCCLLDNPSKVVAAQHTAVKELLELLSASGPERSACLDALLSLMLDCPANQKEFEYYRGIHKVAEWIKNRYVDPSLRLKCAEFMLLLVGNIFSDNDRVKHALDEHLGSECSVIILDVYAKLDLSDADKKRKSLGSLAQKILNVVDS